MALLGFVLAQVADQKWSSTVHKATWCSIANSNRKRICFLKKQRYKPLKKGNMMEKATAWALLIIGAVLISIGMAKAMPVAEEFAMVWIFMGSLIGVCGFLTYLDDFTSEPRKNRRSLIEALTGTE